MGRSQTRAVVLGVVCVGLLGVVTNVATGALPESWNPYLWIAWPLLLVVLGVLVTMEIRRVRPEQNHLHSSPRSRELLIDRVRRYWIRGVLDGSLYQKARIELGLQLRIDAPHPWQALVARPGSTARAVPPGTSVTTVFDELDQLMLIRGAPGAGKTTMLLELVRDLLQRATDDARHPIPVVLPLSTWALTREPLGEWIVRELAGQYEIPRADVVQWLATDQVMPMLDGLDEVAAEHQDACVEAINKFRADRGTTRLVVTCRSEDYERMKRPLRTYGTLTIQPLTRDQVREFLETTGPQLAAVRLALSQDPVLWELLESPLNLSIMVLAYGGVKEGSIQTGGTVAEQRERMLATYVRTMLRRRSHVRFRPRRTARRMAYLAAQLSGNDQTVFTFDQFNEFSVPFRGAPLGTAGSLLLLAGAPLAGAGYLTLGFPGLVLGAAAALAFALGAGLELIDKIDAFWFRDPSKLSEMSHLLSGRFSSDDVFSYHEMRGITAIVAGAGSGLLFGLSRELDIWATAAYGLSVAVAVVIVGWVCEGFTMGLIYLQSRDTHHELPTSRARTIARRGLVIALGVAVLAALVPTILVGLTEDLAAGVTYGGLLAVCAGVYTFLWLGGYLIAEQVVIRVMLHLSKVFPLPGRPFLHYATQCLFLRRVGDSYMFHHLSLQEYFAGMWPSQHQMRDMVDERLPGL
ncbi:NACHT domain-containing NTPase [Kibdelosporangium persicum]|uniref:NACHT domain-containing protein n=1 Tax=Kibdelosporangium persicum TaxID=2698649 RepID=A0ABX2F8S7_9PSEU|nr:NACHT domain-containing protein [Kibdelosporangium persicum]NRN67657.1 NACHT domain-containing protein [Kibdelosporangium persicum]